MKVYSSCFDPRDFSDESMINSAFTEFVLATIFNYSININAGSLFDSEPLHLIWRSFYPSYRDFVRYYRYDPIVVHVEKNRYRDIYGKKNFSVALAEQFISGRITGLKGEKNVLSPDFQAFNVVDSNDIEAIRAHPQFRKMKSGYPAALDFMRRSDIAESIIYFNEYLNRARGNIIAYDSPPSDILRIYIEKVSEIAKIIARDRPDIAQEIFEGVSEISQTGTDIRGSTSALISNARRYFPSTFDTIVRPICKAVSSNLIADAIKPDVYANYELDGIRALGDAYIDKASTVISGSRNFFDASVATGRETLVAKPKELLADIVGKFEWRGLHEVVFSEEYQRKLRSFKTATDAAAKTELRNEFTEYASTRLSEVVPIGWQYRESGHFVVSIDFHGQTYNYAKWTRNFADAADALTGAPVFNYILKNREYKKNRLKSILDNIAPSASPRLQP